MARKNKTVTLDLDVAEIVKEKNVNLSGLINAVIKAGFSDKYQRRHAKVGRKKKFIPAFAIAEGLNRGYSQRKIAKELKVSVSTINRRIKELR